MITKVEARSYRCLRNISQDLQPFEILIGPNASGKSSFLDVVLFLSDVVSEGLEVAVSKRTENFHDLVWGREGNSFQLCIEVSVPEIYAVEIDGTKVERIRYQLTAGIDVESDRLEISSEETQLLLSQRSLASPTWSVHRGLGSVSNTFFRAEGQNEAEFGYDLSPNNSALGSVSGREEFPATSWLGSLLKERVWFVSLDPNDLRTPSPATKSTSRRITGSSLARDVARFQEQQPDRYREWETHLKTALPDLNAVRTQFRPEDRHWYLMLRYENGVEVPSWMISDGTLRLIALTALAYFAELDSVYLIEQPEDGVHPTAIEAIYQSLSSMYGGQALVATHSPLLLSLARPEEIICFRKGEEGAETTAGKDHPVLRDWPGEVNMSEYFAAGVLG